MTYILQVLVGMVVMAIVDIPVIAKVISPTLQRTAPNIVAEKPDVIAALIFYVGYVAMVVYLSQINAESAMDVARNGALLGLFAYGTYEFTNKAVLADWSWRMVAIDTVWGVILTSVVATVAYVVVK